MFDLLSLIFSINGYRCTYFHIWKSTLKFNNIIQIHIKSKNCVTMNLIHIYQIETLYISIYLYFQLKFLCVQIT